MRARLLIQHQFLAVADTRIRICVVIFLIHCLLDEYTSRVHLGMCHICHSEILPGGKCFDERAFMAGVCSSAQGANEL